mmetsp:Transcript_29131/g.93217  ORF Transcript_29131/g.93217 Transcript_29131/m.93217 type:complete len:90 (-) Transcript_29131:202-471(-)
MDQGYDPEDPPCARCVLSGDFEKLTDEDEIAFAKEGLFAKHPKMRTWPESHDFCTPHPKAPNSHPQTPPRRFLRRRTPDTHPSHLPRKP